MTVRRRCLSIALAGGSVLLGVLCLVARAEELWGWTIDDAGITFAYARHLAEGEGPVMTPGGPWVLGISNPLWMVVLAVAHALSFDIAEASKGLGFAFALAAGLVAAYAAPLADDRRRDLGRFAFGLPLGVAALSASFASWTFGGLENSLYALLLVATLALDLRECRDAHRPPWSALTLSLACMTRPEALLYVAAFGALKLVDAARSRAHRRALVRFGAAVVLLVGSQHVLQYLLFGSLVPNTYQAKRPLEGPFPYELGLGYLEQAFEQEHLLVLTPLLLLGWPRRLRAGASILAVLVPALFFVVYARGDWMPRFRFLSWVFPILGLLALLSVRRALGWLADGRGLHALGGAALLVAITVSGLSWYGERAAFFEEQGVVRSCMYCSVLRQSRDVRGAADRLGLPHYSVVVMDLGGFAYETSERVFAVDWGGLCDRTLAVMSPRTRATFPRPTTPGQERSQYLFHELAEPPTLIHLSSHFWPAAGQLPQLQQSYFRLDTRRYGMDRRHFFLHRSRYVDYFPDVDRIAPRSLGAHLRLIGSSCRDGVLRAAITTTEGGHAPEALTLRVDGAAQTIALFEECPECRPQWEPGEPYVIRATLADGARALALEDGEARVALCEGGASRRPRPTLEPFPRSLPVATDPTLRALARRLRAHLRERQRRADYTVHAPELARELLALGERADDDDTRYLAWVLAAQADPAADRHTAEPLYALRAGRSLYRFTATLSALRRAYAGSEADVRRAAALFTELGDEEALAYLRARHPGLEDVVAPAAPEGVEGDFEAPAPRGWRTRGFSVQRAIIDDETFPVTGHRGAHVLASFGPRHTWEAASAGTGEAISAPFAVGDASAIGLWVGGVGRARVALLDGAEGEVTLSETEVTLATELQPLILEVDAGATVRLRVVDADAASAVAVDTVRLWP